MSTRNLKCPQWTKYEKLFLKQNYRTMPIKELSIKLNRTPGAIHCFAVRNGFFKPRTDGWTKEELFILVSNSHLGSKYVAKLIPSRTYDAVIKKATAMRISLKRRSHDSGLTTNTEPCAATVRQDK